MARKQRYVDGRNVPLLVPTAGQPGECCLPPGSPSAVRLRNAVRVDGPAGRQVEADNASNDEAMEAVWLEASPMQRSPIRTQDATRPLPPSIA